MLIETEQLIEQIIKELRVIQGEITITNMMFSQLNEKAMENPLDYIRESNEYIKNMKLNQGKFDAYIKVLSMLGIEYKRDEA